jgi:membrane associated rhomboid family serine protease
MKNEQEPFKFSLITIAIPLYFVLFLWIVFWVETKYDFNFAKYGLYPRTFKGLRGIVVSPFIHSNIKHLFNNSIPLFVLLLSLFFFYKKVAFKVLIYGTLLLGLATWIIGRDAFHIGASGIVYLLFAFIFFSGIFQKFYRLTAVSMMVIFLYGGMIWYIFPTKDGISWEGHLSGLLVGIFFAFYYRKIGPKPPQFAWEKPDYQKDEFDLRFDDDGNYIPPPPPINEIEVIDQEIVYPKITVEYHFVNNEEEE